MLSDIKLVIWDLDETFWDGTLSEGPISPITTHIERVRQLCDRGVMNSICSKNNLCDAQAKLTELGIWESFVFPSIMWAPKGQQVRQIIERMKLRAVNVLVVDDNALNREEIRFHNEGIHVLDPADWTPMDCAGWGKDDHAHSRLKNYKLLESKLDAITEFTGDNEAFLRSSNIRCRICPLDTTQHDMDRVVEVLNRTNQLNFTKRRFHSGLMQLVHELRQSQATSYVIYVDDNYGQYGLCGVVSVSGKQVVEDFAFSCRLLDMGIENALLSYLKGQFPNLHVPFADEIADIQTDWVTLEEGGQTTSDQTADHRAVEPVSMLMPAACFSEVITPFMQPEVHMTGIPDLPALTASMIQKRRSTSVLFWSGGAPELQALFAGSFDILHMAAMVEVTFPTAWIPVVGRIPIPPFLNSSLLRQYPDLDALMLETIKQRGEIFGRRLTDKKTRKDFEFCRAISKRPFVARQLKFSPERYRKSLEKLRKRLPAQTILAITAYPDAPDSAHFGGPWAALNNLVRTQALQATAVARDFAQAQENTFLLEALDAERLNKSDIVGHLSHQESILFSRAFKAQILETLDRQPSRATDAPGLMTQST